MGLMDSSELCDELGISASSLARYRAVGLPCLELPSGRYRYDLDSVLAWLRGELTEACEALDEEELDEEELDEEELDESDSDDDEEDESVCETCGAATEAVSNPDDEGDGDEDDQDDGLEDLDEDDLEDLEDEDLDDD